MNENAGKLDTQLDPALVQAALAQIEPAQRILLIAHERPDGDCIGSALGLTHILEMLGKTCVPACADRPPRNLSFLPGIERVQQTLEDTAFDLVIADECHRGYTTAALSAWRQTLDHFDAIKVGLTATPAAHTKAYFTDVVYRYIPRIQWKGISLCEVLRKFNGSRWRERSVLIHLDRAAVDVSISKIDSSVDNTVIVNRRRAKNSTKRGTTRSRYEG